MEKFGKVLQVFSQLINLGVKYALQGSLNKSEIKVWMTLSTHCINTDAQRQGWSGQEESSYFCKILFICE